MKARMRGFILGWIGFLVTGVATADPITYTTSGTIGISNEPDRTLHGLSGVDPGNVKAVYPEVDPMFPIALGTISIVPFDGFAPSGVGFPDIVGAPFDIQIRFNRSDLPTLDIKGVMGDNGGIPTAENFFGTVRSVTSSDPSLNPALPAPFASMVANPSGVHLGIGMWDWGVSSLHVAASYQTVPEPTAAVPLLLLLSALRLRARTKRINAAEARRPAVP